MAYSDPQSITVGTTPVSLARTGFGINGGTFGSADGTQKLEVSHTYGRRQRRMIRLTASKVSADPLIPTQNSRSSMSTYLVVDTPVNGYTVAEAKQVVDALVAYMSASTGARVSQLLAGEV